MLYGSVPIGDDDPDKSVKAALQHEDERKEQIGKAQAGSKGALSGWLTVRRQFKPTNAGMSTFASTTSRPGDLVGPEAQVEEKEEDVKALNGAQATTYSARIAQTYRQMIEARQAKNVPPKEFFYCVLKGSVLFLYDDEAQSECVAAIGVDKYVVSVEGSEEERFKGKDAEMFSKRTGLVMRLAEDREKGLPMLIKGMEGDETAPWFLFTKSNTK